MDPGQQHGWICKPGEYPANDDGYFENMARVIFQAGLNWRMIETKWPSFLNAFANFSVDRVAGFTPNDLNRPMRDPGIIRNERKILSLLSNALEFQRVRAEYGSFRKYLDSLDKGNNYDAVVKELSKRFHHLGKSTAFFFLYSVGESIKHQDS